MKKLFLFGLLLSQYLICDAQVNRKTFPLSREYKKSGFSVAPLATVSFGNSSTTKRVLDNGREVAYEEVGRGTWNAGLELGWYKTFEGYKVGDYFEAAVSYRRFSGVHYLEFDTLTPLATVNSPIDFENSFEIQKFSIALRAIDIAWQKPKSFLTWGFGVNYDYLFSSTYENEFPVGFESVSQFEDRHAVQVHFQLGYGFTVAKNIRFIPTLETPIVGFLPESPNPGLRFFDVHYQPLVIGLKLMFLRKDPVNCNAPKLNSMPSI